jgi:hypothetical protein
VMISLAQRTTESEVRPSVAVEPQIDIAQPK